MLPLVGGGEHDWANILSRRAALQYETTISAMLIAIGWLGLIATLLSKATPAERLRGYVWGTVQDAIRIYKGSDGVEDESAWAEAKQQIGGLETRRLLRTSTVHAVSTSIDVVDRMYTAVGGTSVYEESPLQRHFRDVHVASQHMMVAEPVMELAGRVMSDIEDNALGL